MNHMYVIVAFLTCYYLSYFSLTSIELTLIAFSNKISIRILFQSLVCFRPTKRKLIKS